MGIEEVGCPLISDSCVGELDVEVALNHVGAGKFQQRVLLLCGFGIVGDAMEKSSLMYIMRGVTQEWGVHGEALGLLGSSSGVGQTIGAYVFGYLSDAFGRRRAFLWALGVTLSVGSVCAAAPNYTSFLLLRLGTNIGLGGALPVGFTLLAEVLPEKKRAQWAPVLYASYGLGRWLTGILAWAVMDFSWRLFVLCIALPSGALLLLSPWLPETPQWFLSQGYQAAARDLIERAASQNRVASPLTQAPLRNKFVVERASLRSAMSGSCLLLSVIWLLAAFGVEWFNWILKILVHNGIPADTALRGLVMFSTCELVVPLLILLVSPLAGGRMRVFFMLLTIMALLTTGVIPLSLSLHSPSVTLISAVVGAYFDTSIWVLLYMITPGFFPAQTRGTSFGICMTCNRFGYIVGPLMAASIVEHDGRLLILCCAGCFAVMSFVAACLPDYGRAH